MLKKLIEEPGKIPSPSRDEMMSMLSKAWDMLDIDTAKEFKTLFVTNALDGSEDFLVSDKLYALVGNDMIKFREQLMKERSAKTLREVIGKLIPPKGVKRKGSDEGIELLDCEEEEIPIGEFEQERDNDNNDDAEEPENVVSSENQARSTTTSTTSKNAFSLTSFTNDPEIKKDAEFLEKFQQIMKNSDTSKLFIPYMSKFRATFRKARHSIKKRIETKESTNDNAGNAENEGSDTLSETVNQTEADSQSPTNQQREPDVQPSEAQTSSDMDIDVSVPEVGEYWEISNGKDSICAQVTISV